MSEPLYILEPYKGMNTRYDCPKCGKRKEFARYINTKTGKYLAPEVGRCNREDSCGYHYTVKEYLQNNGKIDLSHQQATTHAQTKGSIQPASLIPVDLFKDSLDFYDENNFIAFLIDLFGVGVTGKLISKYYIGTASHWEGATVFWQIDISGKIRAGKIMLYNPITGKRVKVPHTHITWVHAALKLPLFELRQCFFGEHLLKDKTKPVAIVESEKTAIIASVYLPQFIWIATGGKNGCKWTTPEVSAVLKGRNVVLFPDLKCLSEWKAKATELSKSIRISVFDLLERSATETEKEQGLDLADYLIQFNYDSSKQTEPEPFKQPQVVQKLAEVRKLEPLPVTQPLSKADTPQPENWTREIIELEKYFKTVTPPAESIMLNSYTTVTNVSLFIESHLLTVNARNGNRIFMPYLHRLHELKQRLAVLI